MIKFYIFKIISHKGKLIEKIFIIKAIKINENNLGIVYF